MMDTQKLAEIFCGTELPKGVCSDGCASMPDYPHPRYGTHLISVTQAKEMFDAVLSKYKEQQPADAVEALEKLMYSPSRERYSK